MEDRVVAGRYRLIRPLGRGGMGTVWLGEDQLAGRQVAVKELRAPAGVSDDERDLYRKRALTEARSAARLAHPNAVTLHDIVPAGVADDAVYLIMEYVEGATLAQVIQREGPLSEPRAAAIALPLLSILEAAHALGIVHRDIKPANIMIGVGGQVKLADFGIAHVVGGTRLTGSGVIGTPAYLAPEQLQGLAITPAVDRWALGVTLYAAVTGRNPFDRETTAATFHAILMAELPPPACAPPLSTVIAGLLVRDPVQRMTIAQARELLTADSAADRAGGGLATHPGNAFSRPGGRLEVPTHPGGPWHPDTVAAGQAPGPPAGRRPGRRRAAVIGAAAVAAAAVVAIAVTTLTPGPQKGTAGAGAVPEAYLGTWHGTLADHTGLEGPQTTDLTLTGGALNAVVGKVSYPDVGCGYDLRLVSAAAIRVELYEQVTSGACISEYVLLAPAGGTISESVYPGPPGGQPDFAGTLSKS
jgi:tRNA A-37 threonylcarbamoyl transferase component Bud32